MCTGGVVWCGDRVCVFVFVLGRGILHYVLIEKRCSARRCMVWGETVYCV